MRQSRLNDAAIAVGRVLTQHGIQHGMFGGCAVSTMGGPRETKDLDIVAVRQNKASIIQHLDGKDGFKAMPGTREDVAVFLWNDREDSSRVTVEIFTDVQEMRAPREVKVQGETKGVGATYILDEMYVFKGKLRAAAMRSKHTDSADLVWLEGRFSTSLALHVHEYDIHLCGLALKRYPHLRYSFSRIGIDVEAAEEAAKGVDMRSLVDSNAPYTVQRGLFG